LVDGIFVTHGAVTLGADGPEVVDVGRASFGLGHVVATFKIENRYYILTPSNTTFIIKLLSYP
jgi:hypothetical protein